jgi:SNF2 family DNA or RNA helicase
MDGYKHGYSVIRVSGMGKGKKLDAALAEHAALVESNPGGLHFLIANAEMCRVKKDTHCPGGICDGDEDWCPEIEKHVNKSTQAHPWLFLKPGTKTVRRRWSAIIADETHNWLINTRGKSASQVGYGFTKLATNDDNFRIAMTGTPLKGKKQNLFGTLNWLRPDVYKSKWRWIDDYFETEEGEYGGKKIHGMAKHREEAFFRSLKAIMIRRTKRELRAANPGWMPPDKVYHDVWVEMDAKQAKLYNTMAKASKVALESGTLSANGALAEMTRLKQFAGMCGDMDGDKFIPKLPSAKFDWLIEFLDERGIERKIGAARYGDLSDDVQKVVVASQFTSQLDVISDELSRMGIRHTMITGKTKDALHEMKMFQNNPAYRVCLINTKAGGVSITLDAADDIVLLDETWVPDEQEQVEDRVHRASNVEHQVDVWYVRTKGTIEEAIAASVSEKSESNHVVLDAQRGLAWVKTFQGTV